jgi:4-hydroxybenzoate polyprenyltransferase
MGFALFLCQKPRKRPIKTGEFSANKKWAISPLISPPAGAVTAILADKFVCILSISQNAGNFNGKE